jgi:hypothetical protein
VIPAGSDGGAEEANIQKNLFGACFARPNHWLPSVAIIGKQKNSQM